MNVENEMSREEIQQMIRKNKELEFEAMLRSKYTKGTYPPNPTLNGLLGALLETK